MALISKACWAGRMTLEKVLLPPWPPSPSSARLMAVGGEHGQIALALAFAHVAHAVIVAVQIDVVADAAVDCRHHYLPIPAI